MSEYIAQVEHICKSFSGVPALTDVHFNLKAGEVHALLGENGAGKSTLVKIMSGVYTKDSGSMTIFGNSVETLTPKRAQELGIAIIHQELNLCQHLTVAENMFLGREIHKYGFLSRRETNQAAAEILNNLQIDLDPETLVSTLQVSKQQMVEIAKALSTNARILIMDEPTSALTAKEIDDLFTIIRKLRDDGCGIIYISHRLDELQYIVDRVTVLRDGKYIKTMDFCDTTQNEIISLMVGRAIEDKFPRVSCEVGDVVFEVKGLNAGRMVRDINIKLREGEIVGIAGLMGAGRTETTRAIFGIDPKESGEIFIKGEPITVNKPMDAIKQGLVLVPEDRKKDGLCTKLSMRSNIGLPNLDILNVFTFVENNKEKDMANNVVTNLKVRLSSIEADAASMSGGNQQKLVVGKWLARDAKVILFDEPTRGIDVAAKIEIYNIMNKLKQEGIGVLFVSSEMPEIIGFSDRIIVMCDGRITGELTREQATQDKIMELATRFEKKDIRGGEQKEMRA